MATALGVISTVGSLANTYQSYKNMKNNQAMSYSDALEQAQNSLDSLYDKKVTSSVKSLDNASASRGFYGQAAADQVKSNTIAGIREDQASAIADLATRLQSASAANAANSQNAFTNSLSNLGGIAANRTASGQGSGLWNWLLNQGMSNDQKIAQYGNINPDLYGSAR